MTGSTPQTPQTQRSGPGTPILFGGTQDTLITLGSRSTTEMGSERDSRVGVPPHDPPCRETPVDRGVGLLFVFRRVVKSFDVRRYFHDP